MLEICVVALILWGSFELLLYLRSRSTKVSLYCTTIIFHNLKIEGIIMATQFPVKNFEAATFKIKNVETGLFIDEVKFANEKAEVSDPAVVSVSVDPADGPDTAILDINGLAEGEADITFSVDATYKDPKSGDSVTVNKSAVLHVTVTKPPVGSTETELVIDLSLPQAS